MAQQFLSLCYKVLISDLKNFNYVEEQQSHHYRLKFWLFINFLVKIYLNMLIQVIQSNDMIIIKIEQNYLLHIFSLQFQLSSLLKHFFLLFSHDHFWLKQTYSQKQYRIILFMFSKNYQQGDEASFGEGVDSRQPQYNNWKMRLALKEQRKNIQKRLFGQHYNYSKVGLNKEKKYMIEEQRNTEIERSNRILLEKIQKIAKRSVPIGLRKRAFTQQVEEEAPIEDKSIFKQSKFFNQHRNTENKSHQQLNRMNISQYRTPRAQKRCLFGGVKSAEGKQYQIKAYIDKDKFILQIELGRMNQKIKIDLQTYKTFFREYLDKDHSKIVQFLQFNGSIFELTNLKRQSVTLQEERFGLPSIDHKNTQPKHGLMDKLDF